jgi:hypothetical protein
MLFVYLFISLHSFCIYFVFFLPLFCIASWATLCDSWELRKPVTELALHAKQVWAYSFSGSVGPFIVKLLIIFPPIPFPPGSSNYEVWERSRNNEFNTRTFHWGRHFASLSLDDVSIQQNWISSSVRDRTKETLQFLLADSFSIGEE